MMEFPEKIKRTIQENDLVKRNDSVLVALSGGPDSVALLHSLAKLRNHFKLKLSAVYINHQIRPAAAKKEELFCRKVCRKLNVNYVTVSENIPKLANRLGKSVEETARDFRYEVFEKLAKKRKCNKVALGHHLEDQVETVLFRIFRGTGPGGLKGIPVKRGIYVRPLYNVTKAEILEFLKENKLKYFLDQTNKKSDYTRNYIRNILLPSVREKINRNADAAILKLVETIAVDEEFLESVTDSAYRECVSYTRAGKLVVAIKSFNDYHLSIKRRLLRRCIVKASGNHTTPDKETIAQVLAVIRERAKAVSIPIGIQCWRKNGELFLVKKRLPGKIRKVLRFGQTNYGELGSFKLEKSAVVRIKDLKRERKSLKVIVDFDRLSLPLLARNIKNGDRFNPLGLGGGKKIGDYLTDRKVNALIRDEIPVVADQKGIIWLVGFEIDERVKIGRSTKRALNIEFVPTDKN